MPDPSTCPGQIDMRRPDGLEPATAVHPDAAYRYTCPECGRQVRLRAVAFMGGHPQPMLGSAGCPHPPSKPPG
jgi:hypothetical protein